MNKTKYPSSFEINEVCTNFIKRRILNGFLQERGIFFFNAGVDDVGGILSNIVMQQSDILELQDNAYQASTKSSLSGFIVKSALPSFSLNDLYEKARDNDRILMSKGYKLGMLSHEKIDSKSIYRGRVDYEIKRPGRIQFIDKEESHSDFCMFENKKGEWQIEVDGTRSSDGREIQKLFSSLINKQDTNISSLNIDFLTDKNTITFFDELIKKGMPPEWLFQDVKSLTFRRARESEDVEELSNENIDSDTKENSPLTGIRQAVLEGRNLREDVFVKQFEESGCIFTAMTFEFHNKLTPEIIHIRAEFKGNPKIFEVSIVNSYEITGIDAKREVAILSQKKNIELRSIFWNNARIIFNELRNNTDR